MKPGTPGFIGARLREAREARYLSAIALADLIGVSRQAISLYENGIQTPRPDVMEAIIKVLKLPDQFFRQPIMESDSDEAIFFRSMSAATKNARNRAKRRYSWMRNIVSYLREFVQFPRVNLPALIVPDDPGRISDDEIEDYAVKARRFWNIGDGPIDNLVWLLENNGVIIARDELGADTLDSLSEFRKQDDTPYIVLGSDKAVAVRSRFDAAHELGHLILHRNVKKTVLAKTPEFRLMESQAHRFGAAFLIPEGSFANDFYSVNLDVLARLKAKWKISIAMMIKRAADLDFASSEQQERLWVNYSRRRWRGREPLDDELQIEQPKFLPRAFEVLINEKIQTREQILSRLPYDANDIENLVGLESGYLGQPQPIPEPSVYILEEARKKIKDKSRRSESSGTRVIQFRKKQRS